MAETLFKVKRENFVYYGSNNPLNDFVEVYIDLTEHDKQIRDEVIEDIISKIDDEYYDGGYGDYHEVAMIVRMLKQMKGGAE